VAILLAKKLDDFLVGFFDGFVGLPRWDKTFQFWDLLELIDRIHSHLFQSSLLRHPGLAQSGMTAWRAQGGRLSEALKTPS
jgi:hypothetical protein